MVQQEPRAIPVHALQAQILPLLVGQLAPPMAKAAPPLSSGSSVTAPVATIDQFNQQNGWAAENGGTPSVASTSSEGPDGAGPSKRRRD